MGAGLEGYMRWKLVKINGKSVEKLSDCIGEWEDELSITLTILPPKFSGIRKADEVEERIADTMERVAWVNKDKDKRKEEHDAKLRDADKKRKERRERDRSDSPLAIAAGP